LIIHGACAHSAAIWLVDSSPKYCCHASRCVCMCVCVCVCC